MKLTNYLNITYLRITRYGVALLACMILAGCGKEQAPEPPLTETKLVLQIFKDLKEKKHQDAADQLTRLTAIQPQNEFLYQLKSAELDNIYLDRILELIADNDLDEAIVMLKKAEISQGRSKRLVELQKELTFLVQIRDLVKAVEYPVSGAKLEEDAVKLKRLLKDYAPAAPYLPALDAKIAVSRQMRRTEQSRAMFSVYSDIAVARKAGDKDMAAVLTAVLICAEPDRKTRDLADYVIQTYSRQDEQ